jgi:hypothetical protein
VIPDLREDLISLVVSRIECYSSCNVLKVEDLDAIECGVVGVFIAPTTKMWPLDGCYRMAHRTGGASRLSGGAPDRSCGLSGAPSARALTLARNVAH